MYKEPNREKITKFEILEVKNTICKIKISLDEPNRIEDKREKSPRT